MKERSALRMQLNELIIQWTASISSYLLLALLVYKGRGIIPGFCQLELQAHS